MFSNLDDAYVTATDLLKSQKNCVYDNILDDDSILETSKPKSMFSAQGDLQSFSQVDDMYKLSGKGTDIDSLIQFGKNNEIPKFSVDRLNEKKTEVVPATELKKMIDQSIQDILNATNVGQQKKRKNKINISSSTKEGIFLIIIGILILLLLDILIRIGRNI